MRDFSAEDKAMRARLERNSSAGQRADVCGILNKVAAGDATARPGLSSYLLLQLARRGEQLQRRHVAADLNKKHDEFFNRLDPKSELKRAIDKAKDTDGGEDVRSVEEMHKLVAAKALQNRYW